MVVDMIVGRPCISSSWCWSSRSCCCCCKVTSVHGVLPVVGDDDNDDDGRLGCCCCCCCCCGGGGGGAAAECSDVIDCCWSCRDERCCCRKFNGSTTTPSDLGSGFTLIGICIYAYRCHNDVSDTLLSTCMQLRQTKTTEEHANSYVNFTDTWLLVYLKRMRFRHYSAMSITEAGQGPLFIFRHFLKKLRQQNRNKL